MRSGNDYVPTAPRARRATNTISDHCQTSTCVGEVATENGEQQEHIAGEHRHDESENQGDTHGEIRPTSATTLDLEKAQILAANDVLLHEVYFDSLGGEDGLGSPTIDPAGELAVAITRDFGNIETWRREFISLAQASTTGWVVLNGSPRLRKLHNDPIGDSGAVRIGSMPLVAIDLHRHAYDRIASTT